MVENEPDSFAHAALGPVTNHGNADFFADNKATTGGSATIGNGLKNKICIVPALAIAAGVLKLGGLAEPMRALHASKRIMPGGLMYTRRALCSTDGRAEVRAARRLRSVCGGHARGGA